jgi:hypothetical protein
VTAAGRKITLNASQSDDPEGNALSYQWFDNGVALVDPPSPNAIHTFNAAAGSHSLSLTVYDVGKLSATAPARTVSCTTSGTTTTCSVL